MRTTIILEYLKLNLENIKIFIFIQIYCLWFNIELICDVETLNDCIFIVFVDEVLLLLIFAYSGNFSGISNVTIFFY